MRKLVIAVDCDDVLTETLPRVVVDYNAVYGTQVGLEHMYSDTPDVAKAFGVDHIQEAIHRLHDIYRRDGYYLSLNIIEGAVEAVKKLAAVHELHLVTGRQSFLESATKTTLDSYFPGLFVSVEHTNYYQDERESQARKRSKADVCRAINADVLIDDHITHGEEVLAAGVERVVVFGDYPWNRHSSLMPGMMRCQDWGAVLREVEKIEQA